MIELIFAFWGFSAFSAVLLANSDNPPKRTQSPVSQTLAEKGDKSSFGHAAEKNLVFRPEQATDSGVTEDVRKAGPERYATVKWTCWALDYACVFVLFGFFDRKFSGENFTPEAAFIMSLLAAFWTTAIDIFKAFLFADVVAEVKLDHIRFLGRELGEILTTVSGIQRLIHFMRGVASGEGLWRDFSVGSNQRRSVLYHMFYFVKVGLVLVPSANWLNAKLASNHFEPLASTATVLWEGSLFETKVSTMAVVYAEYIFLSFIKDALGMQVFHQIMHNQWYSLHKTHHLPMKELSHVNVFFFDLPDLVLENLIAPALLLLIKGMTCDLCGGTPQVHFLANLLLIISDGNIHGICPYTVTFYNPLLDTIMMPNISHHLHHALNVGHYTVWPWHQIKGVSAAKDRSSSDSTVESDLNAYNKVFNTNFPC